MSYYDYSGPGAIVWIISLGISVGLAFIPASIAKKKGYSYGGFWVFGFFLFLVALIVALCLKYKPEAGPYYQNQYSPPPPPYGPGTPPYGQNPYNGQAGYTPYPPPNGQNPYNGQAGYTPYPPPGTPPYPPPNGQNPQAVYPPYPPPYGQNNGAPDGQPPKGPDNN